MSTAFISAAGAAAGAAAMQEADYSGAGAGIFSCLMFLVWLAVMVVILAGFWKVFTKAGQPGWAAIIPIYDLIVLLQIVRRPLWWIVLLFIPLVNVIVGIIVMVDLARVFGKGIGFGVGLLLLPFIFFPVLGFGDAKYQG
jgi:hypothetical protein